MLLRKKIHSNKYLSVIVIEKMNGISLSEFFKSNKVSKNQKNEAYDQIQFFCNQLYFYNWNIDIKIPDDFFVEYPNVFFNYMARLPFAYLINSSSNLNL
jgi:hypothetical protein